MKLSCLAIDITLQQTTVGNVTCLPLQVLTRDTAINDTFSRS
jgi:hypothetical protein